MGKIVILENISKVFDQVVAVDNVTLEIEEGEFVTLLGPSGCGKTTTLRTINGLEMPTSGRVYLDGKDVTGTLPEKRPVNMVFQAYALFPHLSIFENIAFGPRIKKWPEDRIKAGVEEMLRLVQLEGYGSRKPDQLSGGQCQRVALARALINQPKVLLLDEPLGALDLKLRKAMQLELRGIQQRLGMTFVYVTHDQEEAMVMSDRIVLMNEGRIVQDGSPTEIYNYPVDEFVSRFIGEANLLHGLVEAIDGNRTQINVEGIQINAPTIDNLQDGQPVIVSIRPERVILFSGENEAPPDWPNVYKGRVKNAIFLGPTVRYQISLNEKTVVTADRAAIEGEALFSASETVVVGWEAAHSVILPA